MRNAVRASGANAKCEIGAQAGTQASSVWDIRHPCRMPRGKIARQDAPLRTQDACAPAAFTLIELLVVIAIIAILAGLVLSTAGFVQKKGATSRAEAEIAALSAALESYKADMGDYPIGTNGVPTSGTPSGGNNFLLTNLMPLTGKVYFEFSKGMTNSSGNIVDPFGNQYGYYYSPSNAPAGMMNGANFFDIWSTAGSTNTNAWIKNW
jgi:prepilin-type N-terminal cleavage/methylation domain-containing protein